MRENLIKKIKEIVDGEKLAMDSYFFCGSGSSLPDAELISAGESYLNAVSEGKTDDDAKNKLIERLEVAASKQPEVLKARVIIAEDPRIAVIREILQNRELL